MDDFQVIKPANFRSFQIREFPNFHTVKWHQQTIICRISGKPSNGNTERWSREGSSQVSTPFVKIYVLTSRSKCLTSNSWHSNSHWDQANWRGDLYVPSVTIISACAYISFDASHFECSNLYRWLTTWSKLEIASKSYRRQFKRWEEDRFGLLI